GGESYEVEGLSGESKFSSNTSEDGNCDEDEDNGSDFEQSNNAIEIWTKMKKMTRIMCRVSIKATTTQPMSKLWMKIKMKATTIQTISIVLMKDLNRDRKMMAPV
ncbi:unnamed protein product, partial [Brachionus calyciflorus]